MSRATRLYTTLETVRKVLREQGVGAFVPPQVDGDLTPALLALVGQREDAERREREQAELAAEATRQVTETERWLGEMRQRREGCERLLELLIDPRREWLEAEANAQDGTAEIGGATLIVGQEQSQRARQILTMWDWLHAKPVPPAARP
jgi:hypothetical protein